MNKHKHPRNTERQRILEALKQLDRDSDTKVECPQCKQAKLDVQVVVFDDENRRGSGERFVSCHACGLREVALF